MIENMGNLIEAVEAGTTFDIDQNTIPVALYEYEKGMVVVIRPLARNSNHGYLEGTPLEITISPDSIRKAGNTALTPKHIFRDLCSGVVNIYHLVDFFDDPDMAEALHVEESTYEVTYVITGFYTATVKAKSIEEAQEKAEKAYQEADFGAIEDLVTSDCRQTRVATADDKVLWLDE